jgi:branched-chain amino acid aminotransferase
VIAEPRVDHVVWIDGEFVPWRHATMHVSAHHYGFGVFEGVRVYEVEGGAAIFRLADHTERLFRSARMMKLALPQAFSREVLNDAQLELARRNRFGDAYLRPFVFLDGIMGIRPCSRDLAVHVAIMGVEWRPKPVSRPALGNGSGFSLKTSSFIRQPPSSLLAKAKANGNYVAGMLALEEAQSSGADDALLLDQNGFVTETSGANLFIVRGKQLLTPPLSCVLEGITRDTVIQLATEQGLRVTECQLTRDDVFAADEVFLTGTASEIRSVARVDGRLIADGGPGSITRALSESYGACVRGRAKDHHDWVTPVSGSQVREV